MAAAWGSEPVSAAGGGSIPLVNALQAAVPEAEILLVGATDGYANIHAPDERVLLDELEKAVVAEAEFFGAVRRAARGLARVSAGTAAAPEEHTFMQRMLDGIERLGNKMPDPAILFLWLCLGVILLSQAASWLDVKATYEVVKPPPVPAEERYYGGSTEPDFVAPPEPSRAEDYELRTETTEVKGLLTVDGVRFLFTSFVDNFRNFAAVAIILVVMIGVGLAEAAGLIGALIRKLVAVSSSSTLTFIIVLLGMISSVASDAGYLVLIPLGAVAFKSVGRNPLAGIAAAFAGVAAGFGVNFLITPLDGVLTEITNDASALVDPGRGDRPRGEPLLRDRLGALRHRRAHVHHRAARRGPHRTRTTPPTPASSRRRPRRSTPTARRAACATRCGRRSR